jgi:hypothetical protein
MGAPRVLLGMRCPRVTLPPRVTFQFFGYTMRTTDERDRALALAWTSRAMDAGFWLKQEPFRESFIVLRDKTPIALFQSEHVAKRDQVRLHFQASPEIHPKNVLSAVIKLVPLIEKGLALRGVKAIFFTSHSKSMATFMQKHLGYQQAGEGGADGVIMAKGIQQ